jgi:16S rRNA (cytosine1402-N4)-methyltransferase
MAHVPVLLKEVIESSNLSKGKFIVDGTLNGGGHAREIIRKIMPKGTFLGIDLDEEILSVTKSELIAEFSEYKDNLIFKRDNYKNIARLVSEMKLPNPDGIILDLGFSSFHIEESQRGFSFQKDETLDMRYDQSSGIPACQIINSTDEKTLADIIWKFGEERFSRQIAKAIVQERRKKKITSSKELAEIITSAVPVFYRRGKINPATKTFQALRIVVNDELGNLDMFLKTIPQTMSKNGRLAIISFHSLEDRMVKIFFNLLKKENKAKIITKKPITASREEAKLNPKSRSAKLRVLEIL